MEWQLIETAPKDGNDILAWSRMAGYIVVGYDEEANDKDFPWLTLDGPSYFKDLFTHWMPLPKSPE